MSTNEMENKIKKLQKWESLAKEAKAEAEALKDEIKTEIACTPIRLFPSTNA